MKKKILILTLIIICLTSIVYMMFFRQSDEDNYLIYNPQISEIEVVKDKLNIYLFYGEGCPYCEKEIEFFKKIKNKYQDKIIVYAFEAWVNEETDNLLYNFFKLMNDDVRGVPYVIIGEQSFIGFSTTLEDKFIKMIEEELINNFDVLNEIKE